MAGYIIIALHFLFPGIDAKGVENENLTEQIWQAGLPFITHYTPRDYKAHVQNWCFIQDNEGIMYIGNTSGVLEYDGASWRLIELPNGSPAKSFAITDKGTIYTGGVSDLGYLQVNITGQLEFISLLPELDSIYHNFADIWFTFTSGDDVVFISDRYVFRWNNKNFRVWKSEKGYGFAAKVNDCIYIDNIGTGLMCLNNDSLMLIPDGDKFLNTNNTIATILPFGDDRMIMGDYYYGLYLYDHNRITPFEINGRNILKDKMIYGGQITPDGNYIFTTQGKGCFIVDGNGKIIQWLNKKKGLSSDVIIGSYIDRNGNLWLATENGINYLELSSPLRFFGQESGLAEGAERIVYVDDKLYAGTKNGLFFMENVSDDREMIDYQFLKIQGVNKQVRDIVTKGNDIIVGNFDGTYLVRSGKLIRELITENNADLCHSFIHPNRIYCGTMHGKLHVLELRNNRWIAVFTGISIEDRIIRMEEDTDGSLWISTRYNGVYNVKGLDQGLNSNFTVKHYDTSDGLPKVNYNVVYRVKNEIIFSTPDGLYRFDKITQKFKPDAVLMPKMKNFTPASENIVKESANGGIWITGGNSYESSIYKYHQGVLGEIIDSRRISDFGVFDIYELEQLAFFSGIDGAVCFNNRKTGSHIATLPVLLREVSKNENSLIFAGHLPEQRSAGLILPFQQNHLRFTFSLPYYEKTSANQYQYWLEGFDKKWSDWSKENRKELTNLPEGDYRFRVRGKNIYGNISEEAAYSFTVLPPWYRTWWAFLLYLASGLTFVYLIVRWRSGKLRREKIMLENIVKQRTTQLSEQTEVLARQAEQLLAMDKQKSQFFANISHEFRTPLTLIKGPAEMALTSPESLSEEDIRMIHSNTERLLRLVNQLLDLSKIDSGKLELSPSDGDIFEFIRAVSSSFISHAEKREIEYVLNIPGHALFVSFDHDKLEKILYNILSNAFKFNSDRGSVILDVNFRDKQLFIEISDTGIGIPAQKIHRIFDRFYQVDNTLVREYEGTGIGLSLTKELTELMGGVIHVESQPEKGTKFIFVLPVHEISQSDVRFIRPVPEESYLPSEKINNTIGKQKGRVKDNNELPIVLVVEDNAEMRRFIAKQLEHEFGIIEAVNGKSGLKKAMATLPDLVISDLMMPQMDGMSLCLKLKSDERTSHIPVIILTARSDQEQKVEGFETGADDYLTKPFERKELLARVKNLIRQRNLLREKFSTEFILQPGNINITSIEERFLHKVGEFIEINLSDEFFGVPELQQKMMVSKTQLHRKMKALTGMSPGEYIRNYRLKRAAQIIADHGDNITQIAYAVGFSNLSYFAKCFKELYGVAPSGYKLQQ